MAVEFFGVVSSSKIVSNLTAKRIGIAGKKEGVGQFVLPPFGERTIMTKEFNRFNFKPWERLNLIRVVDIKVTGKSEAKKFALGCLFWIFLIGIPLGLLVPGLGTPWYWGSFSGLILIIIFFALFSMKPRLFLQWIIWQWRLIVRLFSQLFSMIPILAIGIGIPALLIYCFGGVGGLITKVITGEFAFKDLLTVGVLARGLQLIFIAIFSLLPALLYFLFERQKSETLRENFFRDIVLLDPNVITLNDAKIKYGNRVTEAYGSTSGVRYLGSTRLPILIATLVITMGWILALLPIGQVENIRKAIELYRFLIPKPTAVNFGFLGAYFFSLNMIFRRYVRADLKPKVYSHITVRFLIVIILVWVLSELPFLNGNSSNPLLLLAFFVGIIPDTALTVIHEFLRNRKILRKAIPSLHVKHSLSMLEGINIYGEARLFEEGIENIENLVHHDLIDSMLMTRIPVPRLVDWIDQGILYLHLGGTVKPESSFTDAEEKEAQASLSTM
ncbi:hypothetical protein KAR91_10225, partial [Candidatus Pacearchaeota archaeon]|nr:hypothetical protein [Candidatus Pacearchaeota archaeon]